MTWSYTPYSLAPLLAALSTGGLAVYAWGRNTRTGRLFALFALAASLWSLSYTFELLGGDLPTKLIFARLGYVGIVSAPVAWLVFTLQYTGREKSLSPRLVALAAVIPIITLALIFSQDVDHLMWSSAWLETSGPFLALGVTHGPWFLVHTAYSYALTFLGALLILLAMLRAPGLYRQQGWALLAGIVLPWIGNAVFISGFSRLPTLDLTSITFSLSAIIFGWAVFRFQLLDLLPVARDALVDASADGLIVLDARNRVVDLNLAARQILNESGGSVLGMPAAQLLTSVGPELLALDAPPARTRAEWAVGANGRQRIYDLSVSPLADPQGRFTGRLIALRDITVHKAIEAELRAQKQLFQNLVAVAHATAEGLSLEDTLQNVINVAAQLTGAERGSLFMLNAAEEVTHSLLTYRGVTPDERQDIVRRVMDRGLSGWVVRHRQGVLIADTSQDPRWLVSPGDLYPVASVLGVPILSGSALVGVLTLSHSQPNRFQEEHLSLMQAAADQIALSLRNAQIYEQQREMATHQAALYGVMRAVGEQLNPQSVARAAVEAIMRLVPGSASWPDVSLALPNAENSHWTSYTHNGQLLVAAGEPHRLGLGIIGRAFATGRTQCVPRVDEDPNYFGERANTRSELAVPLRRGERVLGVLNLESDRADAFGPPDVQLAESLADAVALVLDNANLYQAIAGESSRLQALIKASRDGIFMISTDRRLLVANAPGVALLRLEGEPEDWLGTPIAEVFRHMRRYAPGPVRTLLAAARQIKRGDEPASEGEFEIAPRAIHWVSLPVLSGDRPLGRLLVLRDVTEDHLVLKMREDLTHTMVHDLRNPLTNIRMALELLNQVNGRAAAPDAQQREVVAIALNSTQRMLSLVNAILDVNRLETGQMPLVREPLSLYEAVTEIFRTQLPLIMEKNLRMENNVPPELPPPYVDGGLVRRVLQNLVGNAIKFTPDGGDIRVSAAAEPGSSRVQVTVSDSGPGLPPEVRGSLFQKFVTGHHRERGSGLGLAYCRLAIEAHGGRIWAGNEPGRGAVFHFTLPLAGKNEAEE